MIATPNRAGARTVSVLAVSLLVLALGAITSQSVEAHGSCVTTAWTPTIEPASNSISGEAEYNCNGTNHQTLTVKVCLQKQTSPGVFQDVVCRQGSAESTSFKVESVGKGCPIEGTQWRTWAKGWANDGSVHTDTEISGSAFRDC